MKYNISFFYISTFFSRNHIQVRLVDRCSHAVAEKTWNHSRKCLLGVIKLKLMSNFYIIAKTVKIVGGYACVQCCLTIAKIQEKQQISMYKMQFIDMLMAKLHN